MIFPCHRALFRLVNKQLSTQGCLTSSQFELMSVLHFQLKRPVSTGFHRIKFHTSINVINFPITLSTECIIKSANQHTTNEQQSKLKSVWPGPVPGSVLNIDESAINITSTTTTTPGQDIWLTNWSHVGSLALRHRTQIDLLDPVRSERSACFDAPHLRSHFLEKIRFVLFGKSLITKQTTAEGRGWIYFRPVLDLFWTYLENLAFSQTFIEKAFGIILKCDENKNRDQNRSISPRNTYSRLQEDG